MTDEQLRTLANGVANLGELGQRHQGETTVIVAALAALVASHPDHAAFAAAFRRVWQLLGSQHSAPELGLPAQAGIDAVLSVLEEACAEPLKVRPGR